MDDKLRRVQETEHEMLKELDRICKKHNIAYFLGQGTLLGAAKYKGFIPWDDDLDVLIPYDELERFKKIFPSEAKAEYMLTNYKIERHNPLSWTKIRNKNSLSRPKRYISVPINWGICIDLFPIYPISGFKPLRAAELFMYKAANKMLFAEFTKHEENHGAFTRLLEKVPIGFRHFCMDTVTGIMKLHGNKSEYVALPCRGIKVVRRDIIFGKDEFLEFEGEAYPVPARYSEYLTLNYGDYMGPPPEDEKRGHEDQLGEIEWKLPEEKENEKAYVN